MTRLETATIVGAILVGAILVIIALAFIDWRLGMAAAGVLLVLSAIDLPRRRP